jgi:polyphosphate kinase
MDYSDSKYYLNKQFGWLEFNNRVLEEAQDERTPLLERLKFLAITASNLDEFVMVTVARLKDQIESGYNKQDKVGLRPKELFKELSNRMHQMVKEQYGCLNYVLDTLEEEDINFVEYKDLTEDQKEFLDNYFHDNIHPVLTPMAIDQSRPFPLILNKSLNLAVRLTSSPESNTLSPNKDGKGLFSMVRVPSILPRIVEIPSDDKRNFIFMEKVIKEYLDKLFFGYTIEAVGAFRITRNAEVSLDEEAQNLLVEMERYVKRRKWGFPVRLEIEQGIDCQLKDFLVQSLDLNRKDIYEVAGPIDLTTFMGFSGLDGFDHLRYEPLLPQPAQDFYNKEESIFDLIKEKDLLVHHPYESFDPVIKLVQEASEDSQVLAIKQTLYRVSGDSPIIEALAQAAENGKQVTVLVELKARFDEENNIEWAKKLEKSGCHVVYGLVGLKVHSKLLLIVRDEEEGIRRYVHMSTGNYNDKTAKLYTDTGMFTAKETFGSDVSAMFNLLTGYSSAPQWKKLAVAPLNLRDTFVKLIRNEVEQVKSGKEGHIIAKMNSLVDSGIIKELYKASSAGVKIDLIVRGMCCLKPGIEGVSDNIRVISIVGRLLEHSRIFYFSNGANPKIFMSSADWRPRNLDRRVEALFPVEDEDLKARIIKLLDITLRDNVKAREQQPDGSYKRVERDGVELESQLEFHRLAKKAVKKLDSTNIIALFKQTSARDTNIH